MSNKHCNIVGGGVAGILAALLLKDKFENINIIERSPNLGGLHGRITDEQGYHFDIGTHIPTYTGIEKVDKILFHDIEQWNSFDSLTTGNYFNSKWHDENSLINAASLEKEDYANGLVDFLHLDSPKMDDFKNCLDFLNHRFGETFTKKIYIPVLYKIFGHDIEHLAPSAAVFFGHSRIILGSEHVTNQLKSIPHFDDLLGIHNGGERKLSNPHIYPKHEHGISYWIDSLVDQLKQAGNIQILTNNTISKIEMKKNEVSELELENGNKIKNDLLIWTIPPIMAFLAAGLKVPSSKPTLQTSGIFNYIFDKDVLKKKQLYLWNWDPKYKSIRITLYSNLNPDKFGDKYGLTVEMISSYEEVESTTVHEIWSEMIKLEVIPKGANLISGNKQIIPNTFPIPTVDFSTTIEKQSELFNETFRNGKLLGRSSGKAWFITEIFRQTYESLKDL